MAQPFIIVGLVAVIRKILFVLSGEKLPSASVLALLIAMVAVFILGLIAVSRFDRSEDPDSAGRDPVRARPPGASSAAGPQRSVSSRRTGTCRAGGAG